MPDTATAITFESDGIRLFGRLTEAAAPRAPTIVLLSGLGFHTFEYLDLAPLLASAGYSCLAFDYRGHGRSGGTRGRWTLDDLVADTRAAITWVLARNAGPIALFGNSLGGMVGIRAANSDDRIAAVAASNCPARAADFLLTPPRRFLYTVAKAVAPVLPLRISVNHFYRYDQLIDDPSWVRRISDDRLINEARRLSVVTYRALLDDWDGASEVSRLDKPLLLVQGMRDRLQPGEQTDVLYAAAKQPKTRVQLDTGHLPNLERPDLLATCLGEWLGSALRLRGR